ncbi:serine hydrolase domain-containing protein [Jiangella ureilytica]|nr:serine hydrolase domain-containing protein [Jiangella ureilytica]
MSTTALDRDHWSRRLADLATRHRVPGAALGVAQGAETLEVAVGVTNVETGVDVTTDTLFQIGSVSKVWTASLAMALVDGGKLDLDEPVVSYLPELVLVDHEMTARVTMRHLLTHTSGIDGDFFHDTGRGDDCVEQYVAALATVPANHPLGATWSYCNAGYILAGRVIEKLTGQVWDAALRDVLVTPLGLDHTVTLPEEALLHRAAVGHVHEGDEPPRRAQVWVLPRSAGPAGLIASTVGDVLTFARMHLSDGVAADGTRVLTAQSVAAMQTEQVRLPHPYSKSDSWGLGWCRLDWNGHRLVGHDGGTIGQFSFLRVLPDLDLAVVLLTNGGQALDLYHELFRELFRDVAGVEMAAPVTPPVEPPAVDVSAHAGRYQRTGVRFEVWQDEAGPRLRMISTDTTPGLDRAPKDYALVPVTENVFAVRDPGAETWSPVVFYELADGTPYLHFGRATPKLA